MATGTGTPVATGDDGHYFTITELRASDSALASTVEFTDTECEAARDWAEERFETLARITYIAQTGETFTTIGDGGTYLRLPDPDVSSVTAVTVDGTSLTATELSDLVIWSHGLIKRENGWDSDATIVVTYNHGKTVIPKPVKRAIMLLCKEYLVSNLSSRATSEATDVGFIRLSIAAPGRTGIPEVDAVIADYGHGPTYVG